MISSVLSSWNSTETTRRQRLDRRHVAGNVVLATVVGMLIEVPVMLSVVKIVNTSRARNTSVPRHPELCRMLPRSRNLIPPLMHAADSRNAAENT